ncbi:MAG TPA: hypothetical protein VEQ10_13675 [Vicinamibacteria bacterium]|nr:hypothetical protein [Vicinamibacteria bacterium]
MAISASLLALAARGTVVLAVAGVLVALLGRRRAVGCHRLLTATALCLVILPVLPRVLPRWELSVPGLSSPSGERAARRLDAGDAYGPAVARSDRGALASTLLGSSSPCDENGGWCRCHDRSREPGPRPCATPNGRSVKKAAFAC